VRKKPKSMEKELSRQRPLIFLQQNHLLLRIQFFALAIGQIYASTFRMAAGLGCMVLSSSAAGIRDLMR
jgi:hypothetical protein